MWLITECVCVLNLNGFVLIKFPQFNFTVYFLAYVKDPSLVPTSGEEQWLFAMRTPGCIELTWNYGSESEGPDRIYNTGTSQVTKYIVTAETVLVDV